jgi:hypothetical protein
MNVHNMSRAAGVSHFEQMAQMAPPLSVLLRCSLDKRALPKPKTSFYQRPSSFQEGFLVSAFQYRDTQPDDRERLAATPKSLLAEELDNGRVTRQAVAPLGNRVDPSDPGLLAEQSLQKRREMLEEHACGRSSATAFGLAMSA